MFQHASYLGILPLFFLKSQVISLPKFSYWSNRYKIETCVLELMHHPVAYVAYTRLYEVWLFQFRAKFFLFLAY